MDELVKKDIEMDFYSCLGLFKNVDLLIKHANDYKVNSTDSDNLKMVKESQEKEILVMLGRVGELAFKYLLKNKQIQMYPHQSYDQFSGKGQLFYRGPLNDMVQRKLIKESDLDEIMNYKSKTGADFHNFTYLSLIVEKVIPETYENLKKCYEYEFQSDEVYNYLSKLDKKDYSWEINDGYYLQNFVFPCHIWTGDFEIDDKLWEKEKDKIQDIAQNSGDAFTKLRYFSNNVEGKNYNLQQVYKYIGILVRFVTGIYNNNSNLLTSAEAIHGRVKALSCAELIGREENEINEIFDKYCNNDPLDISQKLFSKYSVSDIDKIEQLCEEYNIDSFMIYYSGISPLELQYFLKNGIDNHHVMSDILCDDNLNRRSFEEVEELVSSYNAGKKL